MRKWILVLNTVVWLPIVLLYLLIWPFVYIYGLGLLFLSWYRLNADGPKVLIIRNGDKDPAGYLTRINEQPAIANRSVDLDFAEKQNWPRWSLPVRLFWQFGPISLPPQFTGHNLPAILLLRKFHRPRCFSFGERSKDRELNFEKALAGLNQP